MEEMKTGESVGPIVATAEVKDNAALQSLEAASAALEARVRDLETALAELRSVRAQSDAPAGRKTAAHVSLLAKGAPEAAAATVDDALRSLSVEQRIAVKSGLMRAGWAG